MNTEELNRLHVLDQLIATPVVQAHLESAVASVEDALRCTPACKAASLRLSVAELSPDFPADILSAHLFALRAHAGFRITRHPNSHERLVSLRGRGVLRVGSTLGPSSRQAMKMTSELGWSVRDRWCSIPPDHWHQALAYDVNWYLLALHTAPEGELLSEHASHWERAPKLAPVRANA